MQLLINLAIWSYVAWLSTCNLTDMEWATILPDMASLCPSVDVCGRTGEGVTNVSTERNQCCLDCSCQSSCHDTHGHCCFDDKNTTPANITACLIPSTNQNINGFGAYTFVLRPPINGCKCQYDATTSATCTSDISVAPWGNFFPVYSKSLNKNFKNEPCALCHGADITDIEPWTSIITYIGGSSEAFASTMTDFYDTFNSSDVAVVFEPPSKESRSMDKRCFEVIEGCSPHYIDKFYIPSVVQLNRSTIVDACTYGPKALYIQDVNRAYKNVYCALCNGFAVRRYDALRCNALSHRGLDMLPFTGVFDSRVLQSLQTTSKDKMRSVPCFRQGSESNSSLCVHTYCPALQTRLPNGKCGYLAGNEITGCLRLFIDISTRHFIDVSHLVNMTETRRLLLFKENSPWPVGWQIADIRLIPALNETGFRVSLRITTGRRLSMRQITAAIKRRLMKRWSLHVNKNIELTQRFSINKYFWDSQLIIYHSPTGIFGYCTSITNMFLCQQIELLPSDYRLESRQLYILHNERILYVGEYTLLLADDGSKRVRVCLEDSGYVKVDSSSDTYHVSYEPRYISKLLFMMVLAFVCV